MVSSLHSKLKSPNTPICPCCRLRCFIPTRPLLPIQSLLPSIEKCAHRIRTPPPPNPPPPQQPLQFSYQKLKSASVNFWPDSILGEGGFGYVFKGWIEENSTSPAMPGTGVTVALKSFKSDGLQGHREWVTEEVDFFGQLHHLNYSVHESELQCRITRD